MHDNCKTGKLQKINSSLLHVQYCLARNCGVSGLAIVMVLEVRFAFERSVLRKVESQCHRRDLDTQHSRHSSIGQEILCMLGYCCVLP